MATKELNRVFILGGKGLTEDDWRQSFDQFGNIEDIWITKDRKTGLHKGITYITYEKTSEACLAVQEMNLKSLPNSDRPLKVILANDKREGSRRTTDEDKMLLRLFVVVPKGQDESDLRSHFEKFGEVDHISTIKDRKTRQPKPLAYITFHKQYHAAKALEECDRAYKPIFADTKPKEEEQYHDYKYGQEGYNSYDDYSNRDYRGSSSGRSFGNQTSNLPPAYNNGPPVGGAPLVGGGGPSLGMGGPPVGMGGPPVGMGGALSGGIGGASLPTGGGTPLDILQNYNHWNECTLEALIPESLQQEHVSRLFDLIPGMRSCQLDKRAGIAYIQYSTPQCASYAKDKVSNMEYPLGYRIAVRYPQPAQRNNYPAQQDNSFGNTAATLNQSITGVAAGGPAINENIQTLVDSIQKATQVLQSAGVVPPAAITAPTNVPVAQEIDHYCNVPLPPRKPYALKEAHVEERLFIVSVRDRFDDTILQDTLCRFGNLISANFMPGKTFGYAKFASKESAEEAIKVLHGQQICGNKMKLMVADPPKYERQDDEPDSKRRRSP